ncbi:hypothetical protein TrLO_g1375 [Triparma laevis f. longispina]|uniref:Methyltransferase domain-containing protein n=1 Tax=Triparma laevis f. longispina TaxID=1714387 RepID=A0A9W7FTI9_9STRA|nr:hypothetical protein TrLO_g1375 [Triparma laevis f. longispina]
MSYGYNENEDSDENDNPLMAGLWMDDDSLAPPCGCEMEFIPWMLEVAAVQSNDTLLDLGAGDGRICRLACLGYHPPSSPSTLHSCSYSIGVEIEPSACTLFNSGIIKDDLEGRCFCLNSDLLDINFDKPIQEVEGVTVITVYLLPEGLVAIEDKIRAWLNAGEAQGNGGVKRRVVCNTWGFKGWEPSRVVKVEKFNYTELFLYDIDSIPLHS